MEKLKFLYDMGFALLWLYPKSKRPIGEDWTTGPRKHWDTLKKTHKEANNVGVRLGSPSKFSDGSFLCVLDCDVKSSDPIHLQEMQKALESFCPSYEYAPRVLSGRGGGSCHIYFRTKEPQTSFKALHSAHKIKVFMPSVDASNADRASLTEKEIAAGYRHRLAWEIDVFGEGKQVVLPPSTHPDTLREYVWEYPLRDFDAIPLLRENFSPKKIRLIKKSDAEIKFDEVDLFSTPISEKYFSLITAGTGFENYPSRSEALFASLNALISAGLNDAQIFTVLTDASNFMSDKPLEAGKNDPSRAARWLKGQIDKIRSEKDASLVFGAAAVVDDVDEILGLSDIEAEAQSDELIEEGHWTQRLKGKEGAYKNTANNIHLILSHCTEGKNLFSYDLFKCSNMYAAAPPWGSPGDVGRELVDSDDIDIKVWLSKKWGIETGAQNIAEICMKIGLENSFHPVRRYLESIKWDGKNRLDTWLREYMGATGDNAYLSAIGRKTLCGAVARVMHPGIKFDHVLIFEGDQGIGKSSAVETLAGKEWFVDSLGDIESKDVVDIMRGRWIVELSELASLDKASTNHLKGFITRTQDVTRKAYGRRAQEYKRQCIFIGTTNDSEYLKDATGGRRFWPVNVNQCKFDALARDRDQLWAEAHYLWALGEPLYLDSDEVRLLAEQEQADRFIIDEIQTQVNAACESYFTENPLIDFLTFEDVWAKMAFSLGGTKPADYHTQRRIKTALRVLGYARTRSWVEGSRAYVWRKNVKGLQYKKY
jgi:predicted P-loop ATPase